MAQAANHREKYRRCKERLEVSRHTTRYKEKLQMHQIRLLTIIPGHDPSPPSCVLSYHWQADYPEYSALSYTWGDPKDTEPIFIDGIETPATRSLAAALRQLRAEQHHRPLWVDAVCIDQSNVDERNFQLLSMRSIYQHASQLIVWLGEEDSDSAFAMSHMQWGLMDHFTKHQDKGLRKRSELFNLLKFNHDTESESDSEEEEEESRMSKALTALCSRSYWSRMWIIQEIAVSNYENIIIHCGPNKVSMRTFDQMLARHHVGKDFVADGRIPNFRSVREGLTIHDLSTLLRLLFLTRGSKATDPRDKIYALRGISSDGEKLVPFPDYSLPLDRVFIDVARAIINATGRLEILLLRSLSRDPDEKSLPSWVPDWNDLALDRQWITESSLRMRGIDISLIRAVEKLTQIKTGPRNPFPQNIISMSQIMFECDAKIIGVIDGISSRLDGIAGQARQMQNASKHQAHHAFGDDDNTAQAILKSLSLAEITQSDDSYWEAWSEADIRELQFKSIGRWTTTLFGLFSKQKRQMMDSYPRICQWLEQNDTLHIAGRSLRDWTELAETSTAKTDRMEKFWIKEYRLVFPNAGQWLIQSIDAVIRYGFRLFVTYNGVIGSANPQARKGDTICQLKNCWFPLVLRQYLDASGKAVYRVVGEAYHPRENLDPRIKNFDYDSKLFIQ